MSGDGPALLVVDDSEDNRYTLTRRLKRQGYDNVETAEHGRHALDVLATRPFDLVLLDIMMPEMTGYEVLETMKSDPNLRDIPVVMISALDEIDSVVHCIELGAEDYLTKPFNPALLRARIGSCLASKRFRDRESAYRSQLESERWRSDDLLHAVLPAEAVRELRATGGIRPRRFEDAAVLACEVVGFAEYCDRHPPEQAVAALQTLTRRFEETALRHELETIRRGGASFLAAAGLLRPVSDPILRTARCGLELAVAGTEPAWQVRVGLHSGPVVAGIVDGRRLAYDVWGETVNTAVGIAGRAEPGRVTMTAAAWGRIRDRCRGRSRGSVEVGDRGEMELVECLEAP